MKAEKEETKREQNSGMDEGKVQRICAPVQKICKMCMENHESAKMYGKYLRVSDGIMLAYFLLKKIAE